MACRHYRALIVPVTRAEHGLWALSSIGIRIDDSKKIERLKICYRHTKFIIKRKTYIEIIILNNYNMKAYYILITY